MCLGSIQADRVKQTWAFQPLERYIQGAFMHPRTSRLSHLNSEKHTSREHSSTAQLNLGSTGLVLTFFITFRSLLLQFVCSNYAQNADKVVPMRRDSLGNAIESRNFLFW